MVAAARALHETKAVVVVVATQEEVPKVRPTKGRRSVAAMGLSFPSFGLRQNVFVVISPATGT